MRDPRRPVTSRPTLVFSSPAERAEPWGRWPRARGCSEGRPARLPQLCSLAHAQGTRSGVPGRVVEESSPETLTSPYPQSRQRLVTGLSMGQVCRGQKGEGASGGGVMSTQWSGCLGPGAEHRKIRR